MPDFTRLNFIGDDYELYIEGNNLSVRSLGGVCTGRLIENLSNIQTLEEDLNLWIDVLRASPSREVSGTDSYILFKPQLLVAVTTEVMDESNEILEAVGFVASPVVSNMKYGEGRGLITWVFALHGFIEEEKY